MKQDVIRCVDVVAWHKRGFVVIERLTQPRGLALPGGKVECGEDEAHAIAREFFEETGLTLGVIKRIGIYDAPDRDPRGSYVSTLFFGTARGMPKNESQKTVVRFFSKQGIEKNKPHFIVDHYQMICECLKMS